ncbi:hypothetical protein E2C01_074922 [Portunus trituberculatus]|uniref:Uncharacterized protein n=1 Tax=Portunus trituberculatus TaxID=210409 RepID=A0A5B7IIH7_PORTR|nr:hypothetical protein [Portunus trituberculatus]
MKEDERVMKAICTHIHQIHERSFGFPFRSSSVHVSRYATNELMQLYRLYRRARPSPRRLAERARPRPSRTLVEEILLEDDACLLE